MRLGSYAPFVCMLTVTACAAAAISDVFTTGPHPSQELPMDRLQIGWLATIASYLLVAWLVLSTRPPARQWAKAALALLLAGSAVWAWTVWPAFWNSLGLDDCRTNCILAEHIAARRDVVQGKWCVALANSAAAICVLVSIKAQRDLMGRARAA